MLFYQILISKWNKNKFDAPIEAVLEFEQEDQWNGLPISTPPYTICSKC